MNNTCQTPIRLPHIALLFSLAAALLAPTNGQGQTDCSFSFSPANPCPGTPVTLQVNNPQAGHKYTWKILPSGSVVPDSGDVVTATFPFQTNPQTYQVVVLDSLAGALVCTDTLTVPVRPAPDISVVLAPGTTPGTQISGNIISLCGNAAPIQLRLSNTSSMAPFTTQYTVNWGDGSPTETYTPTQFPITHVYSALGVYYITFTATHQNGCTATRTYSFFSGTNPPLSFSSPGGTVGLCAPDTLNFVLGGYQGASPGTVYQILVNGKPYQSFTQATIKDTLPVIFTESSCGQGSGPAANIFVVTIRGGVPGCPQTEIDVKPVTISSAPVAAMHVDAPPLACPDEVWKFTNVSWGAAVITPGPNNTYTCDSTNSVEWQITGPDWEYIGGSGPFDQMIQVRFKETGVYLVRMTTYNLNFSCPSGADTKDTLIVVAEKPTAAAVAAAAVGSPPCAPFTLQMHNLSSAGTSASWLVVPIPGTPFDGYAFEVPNGPFLYEPSIRFTKPGTYRIQLIASNPCGNALWDTLIVVQAPPQVGLQPLAVCEGQPLNLQPGQVSAVSNGSSISGWQWAFPGSSLPTSTDSLPQNIVYADSGIYLALLIAANGCGTDTAAVPVTVAAKPRLDVSTTFNGGPDCLPASVAFQQTEQSGVIYERTISSPPNGSAQYLSGGPNTAAADIAFAGAGTYRIELLARNDCDTLAWSWEHTFYEPPAATLPALGPFCDSVWLDFSPNMAGLTLYNGGDAAATYSWSFSGGTPNGSTQPFPGLVFFENNTGAAQTVTATLTLENGCTAAGQPVVVATSFELQTPVALVVAPLPPGICQNTAPLPLLSDPPGVWSGPGVSGNLFNPGTPGLPLGTPLTLTCTVGTGACTSAATAEVVVLAIPDADAGPDQTVCIETSVLPLPDMPGSTWNISPPGMLDPAGTAVDVAASGPSTHTLTLTVSAANGCQNSDVFLLTIHNNFDPNPSDTGFCNVPGLVNLPLFNLPGLTYSGPYAAPGNQFNPDGIASGPVTVPYTMTNSFGCVFSGNIVVQIADPLPPGAVQAGPDLALCAYGPPLNLAGAPQPGFWQSLPGTSALNPIGTFDPSEADTGTYRLVFAVGGGNCADAQTDTMLLRVVRLAPPDGPSASACVNNPAFPLPAQPATPPPGVSVTWTGTGMTAPNAPTFDPALAQTGSHTATIVWTDMASGCAFSAQQLVTVHPLAGSAFAVPNLNCEGAALIFQNNTPPSAVATQAWYADGASVPFSTDFQPAPLFAPGDHTVALVSTTANGCLDTFSLDFFVQALPVAALAAVSPVSGCGPLAVDFDVQVAHADAAWIIVDSAGVPYTLPVQSSFVFENNGSDVVQYQVILVAENACAERRDTVSVVVKSKAVAAFVPTYDQPCSGSAIEAAVTSTGGTTGHYFYTSEQPGLHIPANPLWPTAFQFFTDSLPKVVTLYLVSWNECNTDTASRPITVLPADVSALFNIEADTARLCPGSRVRVSNGSTPGVPVRWETSWGDTFVGDTVDMALPAASGTYTIKVVVEGCGFDTFEMPVRVLDKPAISLVASPYACLGESVLFQVTTSGAAIVLYFGDGDSSQTAISNHAYPAAGTYMPMVVATSLEGCSDTASVAVRVFPPPAFSLLLRDTCTVAAGTDLTVQTDPFNSVELSGAGGYFQIGHFHPGLGPGFYSVLVETPEGCIRDTLVAVPKPQELTLSADADAAFIELGESVTLTAKVNQSDVLFHWSPGQYVADSTAAITEAMPVDDIRFTVTATNVRGCTASASVWINVAKTVALYFPNVFAPESEGANEAWYISASTGVREIRSLQIFNYWGEELFRQNHFPPNDPLLGWRGNFRGKKLLPGVYVFLTEILRVDGQTEWHSGDITLVR